MIFVWKEGQRKEKGWLAQSIQEWWFDLQEWLFWVSRDDFFIVGHEETFTFELTIIVMLCLIYLRNLSSCQKFQDITMINYNKQKFIPTKSLKFSPEKYSIFCRQIPTIVFENVIMYAWPTHHPNKSNRYMIILYKDTTHRYIQVVQKLMEHILYVWGF